MAKEFLDESVLNTAARKLKGTSEQPMRRPPLSNIVSTAGTASTAPQQVILLPAASTGTAGGEQAFLLASTAGGSSFYSPLLYFLSLAHCLRIGHSELFGGCLFGQVNG